MKRNIMLNTQRGSAIEITVEACNGLIYITANIDGTEYSMIRLPSELAQWPINGILRMSGNDGSDFGGQLIVELDEESSQCLDAVLGEAAQRVDDPREYEEAMSEAEAQELLDQLRAEIEADAAPYSPDQDFDFFED